MKFLFAVFLVLSLSACETAQKAEQNDNIVCNPMNLSYRFGLEEPSRREAADPSVVWFRDRFFLFVSKSGGYWHSKDLVRWKFIETNQIPTEEYAPTAIAIGDTLFFLASSNELSTIYKSTDPLSGRWEVAVPQLDQPVWDPAFFMDDDQRLYLYWGCSDERPLYGVELDYSRNFAFKGRPTELIWAKTAENGWEVPGDYNTLTEQKPWIEGPWVVKAAGKYYLQYAGPGTEYKSYSDGMYVADQPLGPFSLQASNPYTAHPEGFAAGAGHGCTFQDQHSNWWHIGTVTISQKHIFERRLALHPVLLDEDGILHSNTAFADYPITIPQYKVNDFDAYTPNWMLLSYRKKVVVSSSLDSLTPDRMTDEDIRTYWAAQSGEAGEYAILDLEKPMEVNAIQINFAEHNTKLLGRQKEKFHRYKLEVSVDGSRWETVVNKSLTETDLPHDFVVFDQALMSRYIKLTNLEVPDGNLALSGFRVFGNAKEAASEQVELISANRNAADLRSISLNWKAANAADGYVLSYGAKADKLYLHHKVFGDTSLVINSLNVHSNYWFSIKSFNASGVSPASIPLRIE